MFGRIISCHILLLLIPYIHWRQTDSMSEQQQTIHSVIENLRHLTSRQPTTWQVWYQHDLLAICECKLWKSRLQNEPRSRKQGVQ